ncbi:glutathione S-transferase family protein [Pyruvatibacter mobilis]|uniref:glutathione S-transferase family protein n=1 Tax=Pyruvatibacter mobilis TaxID=1712261 RepID=UPI003D0CC5EA
MITLYHFPTSPFTEKVRRALNYKGISHELEEVVRADVGSGRYADVSPTGKFPALMDDGNAVWDSTDILLHLERLCPSPALFPSDPREAALAHVIEDWADESLYFYEMTMRLSWEHNLDEALDEFTATLPGVSRDDVRKMVLQGVGQLVAAQGLGRKPQEQVVSDVVRHFRALDDMLAGRDWLAGDALSVADLAVIGQLNALLYAREARAALEDTSNIKTWMARVDAVAPKEGA